MLLDVQMTNKTSGYRPTSLLMLPFLSRMTVLRKYLHVLTTTHTTHSSIKLSVTKEVILGAYSDSLKSELSDPELCLQ